MAQRQVAGSALKKKRRSPMRINQIMLVGIALIILGVVAFAYQGITYTSRENVVNLGPIQANLDTKKTIPLSPLLGGLALAGGIVLVVVGTKK
jgi:accessory gene regulator protein AgrB